MVHYHQALKRRNFSYAIMINVLEFNQLNDEKFKILEGVHHSIKKSFEFIGVITYNFVFTWLISENMF